MELNVISQLFILSTRGDTLAYRDYRGDVSRTSSEVFFRKLKLSKQEPAPIFIENGVNFLWIKKNGMYFVCTTRCNVSPSFAIELLTRLTKVFKDYCGVLSEESMRKNFVLIYELIDEILDFGHVKGASTEGLKSLIFNEAIPMDSALGSGSSSSSSSSASSQLGKMETKLKNTLKSTLKIPDRDPKTVSSSASQRPISMGGQGSDEGKKNEIFVDILERINVMFNQSGSVVTSEIDGSIIMKSFLAGNPELRIGLNEDLQIGKEHRSRGPHLGSVVLDDANFHESVRLPEFESSRTLSLLPPEGEFAVMNYRITGDMAVPFRIFCSVEQVTPFKIEVTVKVRADIPASAHGANVEVRFPVPKSSASVALDVPPTPAGQTTDYRSGEKTVVWTLKKLPGGTEAVCRAKISLGGAASSSASNLRKEIGPISMKFEVPMHNVSGLNVRFLRIESRIPEGPEAPAPARWVRYITQANSYFARV